MNGAHTDSFFLPTTPSLSADTLISTRAGIVFKQWASAVGKETSSSRRTLLFIKTVAYFVLPSKELEEEEHFGVWCISFHSLLASCAEWILFSRHCTAQVLSASKNVLCGWRIFIKKVSFEALYLLSDRVAFALFVLHYS